MVIIVAQHFLLSPAAKTLSLAKVLRMSEEAARELFRQMRWPETEGAPVCPECGCVEHYDLKTRRVYKCKGCGKQFSETSGTIFHGRKLQVRDILGAIAIFINGAKGCSALELSRHLDVDYKTAFVLLHKVREAIGLARDAGALKGDVEVDGAYFGGYVKPANKAEDRKDRRKKVHQSGKRQVVIAMRERGGRTRVFIRKTEAEGAEIAPAVIANGSTVHADEASHWDKLAARFPIKRINHKVAYSLNGACTNMAESFFSRLRRAEVGTHHHISGAYLGYYAEEMAWREDARRNSNGDQFSMALSAITIAPKSERLCGYWQK